MIILNIAIPLQHRAFKEADVCDAESSAGFGEAVRIAP